MLISRTLSSPLMSQPESVFAGVSAPVSDAPVSDAPVSDAPVSVAAVPDTRCRNCGDLTPNRRCDQCTTIFEALVAAGMCGAQAGLNIAKVRRGEKTMADCIAEIRHPRQAASASNAGVAFVPAPAQVKPMAVAASDQQVAAPAHVEPVAAAASVQQVAPRPSAAGMFGPSGPVRHQPGQPGRGGHYAAPAGRGGHYAAPAGRGGQQDVLAQVMLANVAYVNMMTKRASQPKKPP